MAVADIPSELIVNGRSSWDQFLWELPSTGLYRWDKNIGYMYAYGAIPVEGQGLPPGPPIPNPDAPFSLGEISYLNSLYARTVNGLGPDENGNVPVVALPVAPEGGWTEQDFTEAVREELAKAATASQPGHTHVAADILDGNDAWVAPTRTITGGGGLTGGGDLSQDRTITLSTEAELALERAGSAVQPADLAVYLRTVNGVGPDADGNVVVTVEGGGYIKPAGGIPATDMTAGVQASLGKADTALQSAPVTSVAGKTGAVTLVPADVGAAPAVHTHVAADITDSTTVGRSILTAASAAAARTAIGTAASATTVTGTGSLTGGGDLSANRTLDLTAAAKTSLGKADTAVQPADASVAVGAWKAWNPSGYTSTAKYRLTPTEVQWQGQLTLTSGNHPVNTNNVVGTLPSEAQPLSFTRLSWWMYGTVFAGLQINTTGVMSLQTGSVAGADFYLNGLHYAR